MSISKIDFEQVSDSDILELINSKVPEGLSLEYKQDIYGKSDSEKQEYLKDLSAFANSHGGHLIIGIAEKGGVADEIRGLEIDTDSEIQKLDQIARYSIEPPITNLKFRAIKVKKKTVIIIRIPKSWNPPHRVTFKGANKFFVRNSVGVHQPSVEELRSIFNLSQSLIEKIQDFRNNRIIKIINDVGSRPLKDEGRFIVHIIPVASFSSSFRLNPEDVSRINDYFFPMDASGMTPRFNLNGFINERGGYPNIGYTQVFRNGIIEATIGNITYQGRGSILIDANGLEGSFFKALPKYIDGLKLLDVPPPFYLMVTIEGIKGVRYKVNQEPWHDNDTPFEENILFLPESLISDYGSSYEYQKSVRYTFDALWNAVGFSKSIYFDDSGAWKGRK